MDKNYQYNAALKKKLGAAIHLVRLGKLDEARKLIKEILAEYPLYEPAWLWFADTFSNEKERLQILQIYVNKFPESRQAARVGKYARKRLLELAEPVVEPQVNEENLIQEEPEPEPEYSGLINLDSEPKFEPEPLVEEPEVQEDWLPEAIVEDFSRASRVVGQVLEGDFIEEEPWPEVEEETQETQQTGAQTETSEQFEEDVLFEASSEVELMSEENLLELLAQENRPEEIWDRKKDEPLKTPAEPEPVEQKTVLQEEQMVFEIEEETPSTQEMQAFLGSVISAEETKDSSPFLETEEKAFDKTAEESHPWQTPFISAESVEEEPPEEEDNVLPSGDAEEEPDFDFDLSSFFTEEPAQTQPSLSGSTEKTRPRKQVLEEKLLSETEEEKISQIEELAGVSGLDVDSFLEPEEELEDFPFLEEVSDSQEAKIDFFPLIEEAPEKLSLEENEPAREEKPDFSNEEIREESDLNQEEPAIPQDLDDEKHQNKVAEFEQFLKKIQNEKQDVEGLSTPGESEIEDILFSPAEESPFLDNTSSQLEPGSQGFAENFFSAEKEEDQGALNLAESETLKALSEMLHEQEPVEDEQIEKNSSFFDDLAELNGAFQTEDKTGDEDFSEDDFQAEISEAFEEIGEIGPDEFTEASMDDDEEFQRWSEAEEELRGKKSSSADRTILIISVLVILFTVILAIIWTVTRW